MENVALRTGVASMFDLVKNGKRAGNNQAAIKFFPVIFPSIRANRIQTPT
jgi:hypothetical protein